jgi:peptidoglycan/LPS O-acetylase OafA/YrhL
VGAQGLRVVMRLVFNHCHVARGPHTQDARMTTAVTAVDSHGHRAPAQTLPGTPNHFTVLRMVAATAVLVDHSYRLVGRTPPLSRLIGFADVGTLAVYVFFTISGYLLLSSWASRPRLLLFAVKRTLRIVPALAVAVVGTALVLGPLLTTLPMGEYLGAGQTWRYVLWNLVLYRPQYALPGVFTGQPTSAVNGSIWTLCYEVSLYTLVPLLGLLLLRRRRALGALVVAGLAVLPWDHLPAAIPMLEGLNSGVLAVFARYFLAGALLFAYRDRVPRRWWIAAAGLLVLGLSLGHGWAPWVSYLVLPYAVVYAAQVDAPLLGRLCRRRDLSYGMYVWAFPVQQSILCVAGGALRPSVLCAAALPATASFAVLSWHLVEAPAMRAKRLLSGLDAPPGESAPARRRLVLAIATGALAGVATAILALAPGRFGQPVAALAVRAAGVPGPTGTPQPAPSPSVRAASRPAVPPPAPPPVRPAQPKPILIYLHGLNESPQDPTLPALLDAARRDGYRVLFTDEGGPRTWGNADVVAAIAALKARYSPDRPIRLLGVSMGTLALVNYIAAAPPGSVSSAVGILPITRLPTEPGDVVTERWAHAPQPAQFVGVPYQMWYGTADTYAGYPTTYGPHVSAVAMPGARHALPIPYDLDAIFRFLDTDGAGGV